MELVYTNVTDAEKTAKIISRNLNKPWNYTEKDGKFYVTLPEGEDKDRGIIGIEFEKPIDI
jgi:hypothetical protein